MMSRSSKESPVSRSAFNTPSVYSLGYFAIMLLSTAYSLFYSFYYIDTLGLGIGMYALARGIYVVWDVSVQPLAGYASDRTRTRMGRRRPWMFGAIPFYALFFILLYSVPGGLTHWGLFFWFLAFQLLFETSMAIISINYLALFPELYPDPRRRARVSVLQQAFYIVALVVGTALTPILYGWLGFSGMAIVYAIAFILLMLVSTLFLRENPAASVEEPMKLREAFRVTLSNGPFWVFNISYLLAASVLGLTSATIAFYAKYVLGLQGAQVSILLVTTFVMVVPMAIGWYFVVRRLGPLRSFKLSIVVFAASVIPLFFARDLATGLVAGAVLAIGLAGHFVIPPLVQAQIIDVDAAKTGRRREGMYLSVGNVLVRTSALVGALAFVIAGGLFGYVSGDQPGPEPAATFTFLMTTVPLGLLVISFVIALFLRQRDFTVPPGTNIALGDGSDESTRSESAREAEIALSAKKPIA
jgi:GPH family glycoside/pentoside/hexuronide:cation symporter